MSKQLATIGAFDGATARTSHIGNQELMKNAIPSKGRLHFLDTLRGLAAVYVVLYHMVVMPHPGLDTPVWASKFAHTGGTGVTLFFVVSAFSLFYTMPFRLAKPRPVLSFYLHRFFRIAPLFYVIIIATIIRDHWVFQATHPLSEKLASFLFIFNLLPEGQQGFVWASWTIGVEMLFYAIFPFIYFRTKSIYAAVSWVIGFLLLWQLVQTGLEYLPLTAEQHTAIVQWSVFKHLPIFACGAVAYFVLKGHFEDARESARRELGYMLLLAGAFVYMALLNDWLPNLLGNNYYWQGLVYLLLLIGLCYAPIKSIVNRVTMHLGQISYSVYLIHPTVVYLMIPVYRRIYLHVPTTTLAMLTCFAITLAIVIALAEITYRWVEEPGIKLGSYVYRRWFATPAATEPVLAK
ncbi:acyltransferase family protein [Dyella japonica]|uniref:acyltransferase family protein n=1 Tax=Dyella japonica TaxID=231455 RepID=UPI0012E03B74|nr:acyltransferase [Dyella japonica]